MEPNIVLIGFMGTGKSVAGRRLARRLNREFIDMDQEIEKFLGMSIAEVFARFGEVRFRSEEHLMVRRLAEMENKVISTGGGVVLNPENMRLLRKNGIIVALTADPEVVFRRVAGNRRRPLLVRADLETVRKRMETRAPYYRDADIVVDSSEGSPEDTVEEIIRALRKYRKTRNGEKR